MSLSNVRFPPLANHAKILALTARHEEHHASRTLNSGALGLCFEKSPQQILMAAIQTVSVGKRYIDPALNSSLVNKLAQGKASQPVLTPRERQIQKLITEGACNRIRLQKAGVARGGNVCAVAQHVHAERVANPAFDIDEVIRLTCAVAIGTIKVERCPHCGSVIVMQPNEVHVEQCCFVCNPNPSAKTRIRLSTAVPIEFPDPEQIEEVVEELVGPIRPQPSW